VFTDHVLGATVSAFQFGASAETAISKATTELKPQRLKPHSFSVAAARLKSCPDEESGARRQGLPTRTLAQLKMQTSENNELNCARGDCYVQRNHAQFIQLFETGVQFADGMLHLIVAANTQDPWS
jgi:hypothetical protein